MSKDNHLYYKPDADGMKKIEQLRLKVIELDDLIDELVGSDIKFPHVGRPTSIAKTKLEECRMFAVSAIVRKHAVTS